MLAPSRLPEPFAAWNRAHGAPSGYPRPKREFFRRFYSDDAWQRLRGPFSLQGNNRTRSFEYPWAYHAADLTGRRHVAEIGGSLAGFQFTLSRLGHKVTNVDPGLEADGVGWPCDQSSISRLNRWFGTDVELKNTTIGRADLPSDHFDLFYSISVLEHLPEADVVEVMRHVRRCLKPGGRFVITLDLFLNLAPFTARLSNDYGTNQNVQRLVELSGLQLVHGNRAELYGFPEFDAPAILARLEDYFIGGYPVLTQCLVLEKT